MDYFIEALNTDKYLFIDQANPKHIDINKVVTKNISSKTLFYIIEKFSSYFIKLNFENEAILKSILDENNINFNYKSIAKKMLSQIKVSSIFFKWKKPKIYFTTVAYINSARIKAAKNLGIKVIEFQHGIISKTHVAYNVDKNIDSNFYPDYLLTFGEKEKSIFDSNNFYIDSKNILSLGSFYIDYLSKNKPVIGNEILNLKKKYLKIVSFSCQDPFDEISMPFVKKTALLNKEIAYIIMPRFNSKKFFEQFQFPENVYFFPNLNTYQIIQLSDIHSTLFSTTAIEALSLGKPNILLNIDELPKKHFKNIIDSNEYTFFVDTPNKFVEKVLNIEETDPKEIIDSNSSNFTPNFESNVNNIISIIEK